jgi:putative addiction module killer protein
MIEVRKTQTFGQWIDGLRDRAGARVILDHVQRLTLGLGDLKSVGDGVSELRVNVGPGYRVYLIKKADILIVLLSGSDKSDQKRAIKRAKQLAKDIKL